MGKDLSNFLVRTRLGLFRALSINPDSTHGAYISKTLSQETIFSDADFLSWSLSNIPLGSFAPALLNKRTHRACGQPHESRTGFILRVDLESNLDLVSKFSPLSPNQIACHISNLPRWQCN
jgi:hypothetical protein